MLQDGFASVGCDVTSNAPAASEKKRNYEKELQWLNAKIKDLFKEKKDLRRQLALTFTSQPDFTSSDDDSEGVQVTQMTARGSKSRRCNDR